MPTDPERGGCCLERVALGAECTYGVVLEFVRGPVDCPEGRSGAGGDDGCAVRARGGQLGDLNGPPTVIVAECERAQGSTAHGISFFVTR